MSMDRVKRYWEAFKNVAIVFSFIVNLIFVIALLVVTVPALRTTFAIKTGLVEPMLEDLDQAFVQLGESTIETQIPIDQQVPIQFQLPLDEQLGIDFPLPIEQNTTVVLTEDVPLERPARFVLPGAGGAINGSVRLELPEGLSLPIRLNMVVPVTSTIPVRMDVPVDQQVRIRMNVPVDIPLGEAGLDPAVQELRGVFQPLSEKLDQLPDGVRLW